MKRLLTQALRFFGLSGIGWLLDFGTYTLLGFASPNLVLNNIISSWIGVTFVFLTATKKVFQNDSRIPLKAKYVIYLVYQCVLIYLISKLLGWVNAVLLANISWKFVQHFSTVIAKIVVTPITMILNFLVMKEIIEKL